MKTPNYFGDRTRNSQLRKKFTAMHHGIVTIPPLAHFIAVIQLFSRLGLVIGNLNSGKGNMYFWFTDVNKTKFF